ncbi:hypothetical protein [Nocardioides daeguensis]|uniref:Type VII secretion integral membrane protein EccD n=1 Tax=Nocardioides daeguensis TaxID=908359 RepID=A0ABP6UQ30_9ACTN|nr:hypothetical protein [Nocardioides daeguensis]MBV6728701.1 hypothetical protein [Nocardioides daeguensis]MCR1773690.1 hypothetical protein [Nocardioides daeguensis]
MSGTPRTPAPGTVTAVSVHGPRGVLDLTVPVEATLEDVSRAYSVEAGIPVVLPLVTRSGEPLQLAAVVGEVGLVAGSVVVAVDPSARPAPPRSRPRPGEGGEAPLVAGRASAAWFVLAVAVAGVAGWCASQLSYDDRWPVVAVLLVAALVGSLPIGVLRAQRVLAAPAFAAAAGFALAWDPAPERLPTVCGIAALGAAVTAGVGRALAEPDSVALDGLRVWIAVGAGWFVVAGVGALSGVAPQVVWAVLYLAAVLAARFVPEFVVDVPDQYLLDLERLAVTAWSARERPTGRRGRIVVPEQAVQAVADRGARAVTAASTAVLAVAVLTAPLLLATATLPLDRTGARCLVGFGGAALLLAARSYRHVAAGRLLRLAGVISLAVLSVALLGLAPGGPDPVVAPGLVAALAVALAAALVLAAVFVGRGWRSAWWSRRAEIAEAMCGAFAVGSLVVAVGFFRHLWEVTG